MWGRVNTTPLDGKNRWLKQMATVLSNTDEVVNNMAVLERRPTSHIHLEIPLALLDVWVVLKKYPHSLEFACVLTGYVLTGYVLILPEAAQQLPIFPKSFSTQGYSVLFSTVAIHFCQPRAWCLPHLTY